jgi:hypothetical protein
VRAGHSDRQPDDRAAAAHARWQAGLPARNTFERDAYAAVEANLVAGMNHLLFQITTGGGHDIELEAGG